MPAKNCIALVLAAVAVSGRYTTVTGYDAPSVTSPISSVPAEYTPSSSVVMVGGPSVLTTFTRDPPGVTTVINGVTTVVGGVYHDHKPTPTSEPAVYTPSSSVVMVGGPSVLTTFTRDPQGVTTVIKGVTTVLYGDGPSTYSDYKPTPSTTSVPGPPPSVTPHPGGLLNTNGATGLGVSFTALAGASVVAAVIGAVGF